MAEPNDFGGRDRSHFSIDAFRETAAYAFPARAQSRKPLRAAKIAVEDVPGQPGWYRCNMAVRPHFKYMGAAFTLSLVGKLDKT